jgi:hypothetical protein
MFSLYIFLYIHCIDIQFQKHGTGKLRFLNYILFNVFFIDKSDLFFIFRNYNYDLV